MIDLPYLVFKSEFAVFTFEFSLVQMNNIDVPLNSGFTIEQQTTLITFMFLSMCTSKVALEIVLMEESFWTCFASKFSSIAMKLHHMVLLCVVFGEYLIAIVTLVLSLLLA